MLIFLLIGCRSGYVDLSPAIPTLVLIDDELPHERIWDDGSVHSRCDPLDQPFYTDHSLSFQIRNISNVAVTLTWPLEPDKSDPLVQAWPDLDAERMDSTMEARLLPGETLNVLASIHLYCDGDTAPSIGTHATNLHYQVWECMESADDVDTYDVCTVPTEPTEDLFWPAKVVIK